MHQLTCTTMNAVCIARLPPPPWGIHPHQAVTLSSYCSGIQGLLWENMMYHPQNQKYIVCHNAAKPQWRATWIENSVSSVLCFKEQTDRQTYIQKSLLQYSIPYKGWSSNQYVKTDVATFYSVSFLSYYIWNFPVDIACSDRARNLDMFVNFAHMQYFCVCLCLSICTGCLEKSWSLATVNIMEFKKISHGSVATLKVWWLYNDFFIAALMLNLSVQEFWWHI